MVSHWESIGLNGLFEFKQNDADKNIVANIAVFLKLQVEVKSQPQQRLWRPCYDFLMRMYFLFKTSAQVYIYN